MKSCFHLLVLGLSVASTTVAFADGATSEATESKVRVVAKSTLPYADQIGRLVTVLLDRRQTPGHYEVVFEAGGLPSGVYVYRMTAGEYSASRKLLLTK